MTDGGKMNKNKNVQKKKYPIKISDWINYLNGETSTNITYYAGVITIFILIIITFFELNTMIEGIDDFGLFSIFFFLVIIFGTFAYIVNDYYTAPYQDLCMKIIQGEITEPIVILEEYNKIENVKRKRLIQKLKIMKRIPKVNNSKSIKLDESDEIIEEIQHLKHLETAIIPILVAIAIFGLPLYLRSSNALSFSLLAYVFGFSFFLTIFHLKSMILKDMRGRLAAFFVDACFLFILPIASISIIIQYLLFGELNILNFSIYRIIALILIIIIDTLIILLILNRKIIPAFLDKIFPKLYLKYEIPKFYFDKTRKKGK